MVCVCSSSSRQRSTSASSISSISSKSPLATASLVKGHNLSAGCSSGEPVGRNSRCIPLRYLNLTARVPAGLIEDQKDAFVLAGSHLLGELPESHREQFLVDRGQDQPVHLSGCGTYEAIEVGPLVPPLDPGYGPLTDRCPYPTHHWLEAQPGFVLGPELDLGLRMGLLDDLYPLRESFLKASCSEESAEAFWG